MLLQSPELKDLRLLLLNKAVKELMAFLNGSLGFAFLHRGDVTGQNRQFSDDGSEIVE